MNESSPLDRRSFLKTSFGAAAATSVLPVGQALAADDALFHISIAEWSLNRAIRKGELKNLDFPGFAKKEFGITAVEYVNGLFKDKKPDETKELKKRCEDEGVKSLLIMCDGCGMVGHPEEAERNKTVDNHKTWMDAAKMLGCHSIRVNAGSKGERGEQVKLAADGLRRLSEVAKPMGLNVLVENHGGLSSDGAWLAEVMKTVDLDNCGTLPDFGNFNIGGGKSYDRYKGIEELMPFAKAVSAKSHDFDAEGNETKSDYFRIMKTVLDAGYNGYVGIEYEGGKLSEVDGIRATQKLLQRVHDQMAKDKKKAA
ncbi:MAG: sugar phosphate isomerase/epimerase family protein [Verrucomicrobiota bacterium]